MRNTFDRRLTGDSLIDVAELSLTAPLWATAPIALATLAVLLRRPIRRSFWILIPVPIIVAVVAALLAVNAFMNVPRDGYDGLVAAGIGVLLMIWAAGIATVVTVPSALLISRIENASGRAIIGLGLAGASLVAGLVFAITR